MKPVKISHESGRWASPAVDSALKFIANKEGVEVLDLTCEMVEATRHPQLGWGRQVWVYSGEFDADTAWMLWAPNKTIQMWNRTVGTKA